MSFGCFWHHVSAAADFSCLLVFCVAGNNRTNSFVEDGKLFLQPTLTSDYLGAEQLRNGVESALQQGYSIAPT